MSFATLVLPKRFDFVWKRLRAFFLSRNWTRIRTEFVEAFGFSYLQNSSKTYGKKWINSQCSVWSLDWSHSHPPCHRRWRESKNNFLFCFIISCLLCFFSSFLQFFFSFFIFSQFLVQLFNLLPACFYRLSPSLRQCVRRINSNLHTCQWCASTVHQAKRCMARVCQF